MQGSGWPQGDWFIDFSNPTDLTAYEKQRVLVKGKSPFQDYEIFASRFWGLVLILDGRLQSAERDEFIYHEALAQPALIAHPAPRRVLVLGGGEGATLREALRHPTVTRAVMVDLDAKLVEVCRRWLPSFHGGAFADPRTELVYADGRAWLAEQADGSFDVVLLDLPEPLEEGPARLLFTREMYALVRQKLAPGGLVALQSGSAGALARLMADLNCTLRAVFPQVMAYTAFVPSFMDLYGFHMAGGEDFSWPTPSQAAARLKERGVAGLRWFSPALAPALPLLPAYLQEKLAGAGRLLTDAAPYGPEAGERLYF